MNLKLPPYLLSLACVLVLTSCANYKTVPYFQNAASFQNSPDIKLYDITIKPKDMLSIFVFSADQEAAVKFNMVTTAPLELNNLRSTYNVGRIHHYLVDSNGDIDFPIVGKINIAGLTIEQANARIKESISGYFKEGTDYIVNTQIDNFEIIVMGEVKRPNTFTVTHNKINVLEALALAGDMTIYGKRENVKVLREKEDGEYEIHELDMRDANVLNSPYYYLQQRDIVYVEPNLAMVQNAQVGETTRLWFRGASIVISLGSLLYRVLE